MKFKDKLIILIEDHEWYKRPDEVTADKIIKLFKDSEQSKRRDVRESGTQSK